MKYMIVRTADEFVESVAAVVRPVTDDVVRQAGVVRAPEVVLGGAHAWGQPGIYLTPPPNTHTTLIICNLQLMHFPLLIDISYS